jgi:hypothetical protein
MADMAPKKGAAAGVLKGRTAFKKRYRFGLTCNARLDSLEKFAQNVTRC